MEAKHSNYFEGTLQLRNTTDDVLKYVLAAANRKKVGIARTEKIKTGIDLYVTSNKFLQIMGKELQQKFGGEVKLSKKLHSVSKNTSKKLYRGTVLFRMPNFKKGDTISYKGQGAVVVSIEKKILLRLESGKKVSLRYNQL